MLNKLKKAFIPHAHNDYRPHALRQKWLSIYTLGLMISHFAFGVAFYSGPSNADQVTLTNDIYWLTNTARSENNIHTLKTNKKLTDAAYAKLTDMFQKNYWDHVSPTGVEAWYFISQQGYEYTSAGENLARGFTNSRGVFNAWMASPSHRSNILDTRHSEIGVAVGTDTLSGKSTTVIVQIFGTQKASPPPIQIASETPQKTVVKQSVKGETKEKTKVKSRKPVLQTKELAKKVLSLGEKKTTPTLSLYNATSATKLPYLALWAFILMLVFFDFAMLKRAGAEKLHPHSFHFRTALTLSIFFFVLLTVGVISIA